MRGWEEFHRYLRGRGVNSDSLNDNFSKTLCPAVYNF